MQGGSPGFFRRMGPWIGGAALMVVCSSANAAVRYNFTSFDGPGANGGGTTVNGINNAGDVVGFSSDNAGNPTLLTNFIRNPNGTFQTLNINNDPLAMANGINDSGAVVGTSNNGAFVSTGGNFSVLPPVNGTTASQTAFGINDHGQIVGQYTDGATGLSPGFLYNGGAYSILAPLPTAFVTNLQGINNDGLVTGFYSSDGVHQHGFFYNSTADTFSLAPDPNIANLVLTQFLGLNDDGQAVGYYQTNDGSQHGFLFNIATDAYTFLDDPSAATSGFSITQITGINDSGELTGFYLDPGTGLQRGFVATVAVPEPSTWAMLLLGFAGVGVAGLRTARTSIPITG
ncbi:MAG: PEP-CTERM sorting domain-containing protein [Roseiarcus sp.]